MKKLLVIILIILVVACAIAGFLIAGPGTGFTTPEKILYIRTSAATKEAVMDSIRTNKIVMSEAAFDFLATRMGYWKNIKPGKYEIKKGNSILTIVRMLRNGHQNDVDLVITKLRTKEDLAKLTGKKFEADSAQMMRFLNSPDSLEKYDVSPEMSMWYILPDTYTYHWSSSPSVIYEKLYEASNRFWNDERKQKAQQIGLTPQQAYVLASIIEEETNNDEEKDTIASVYLNRYKIGMPLQADPTLKFAVRDFSLKKIAGEILDVESPFNTYRNKGLPPGPICTPSRTTIDKVLNPATTDYLYFVAKPKLGGHLFSSTYAEHLKKRSDYLAADKLRQQKEKNGK
ncbi:MAG: endolytic transglycosylase MltG [Flavisolibacter sp.]|jgi:UPF0755 protein